MPLMIYVRVNRSYTSNVLTTLPQNTMVILV
nr:MAG TPA: hypothetical protein [Caudoviricetes sp.]